MKRYMFCFTNGESIKITANNLKKNEDGSIVLFIGEEVVSVFNWNNIACWVVLENV